MADRVLVVDDEQSLRKVLAATLQREGYEVQVASDGEEALAALDRDGADVVVTDLVMPRMDGLSLLRKVVARHPDVPVIVVTAHGRVAAVRQEGDETHVDLEVWTDSDTGQRLAPGTATVAFPAKG